MKASHLFSLEDHSNIIEKYNMMVHKQVHLSQ